MPWLGFIERAEARALQGAKPVRLADITRVGVAGWPAPQWREVPPGECVHGCLTSRGVFAIYDAVVALVDASRPASQARHAEPSQTHGPRKARPM